jgi:hypothetical protein
MLDAAMTREIEDSFLAEDGRVEIAVGKDQLIILGLRLGYDFAVRIDDHAAGNHMVSVFGAALCHRNQPGRVLIGAGLNSQAIMEPALLRPFLGFLRIG